MGFWQSLQMRDTYAEAWLWNIPRAHCFSFRKKFCSEVHTIGVTTMLDTAADETRSPEWAPVPSGLHTPAKWPRFEYRGGIERQKHTAQLILQSTSTLALPLPWTGSNGLKFTHLLSLCKSEEHFLFKLGGGTGEAGGRREEKRRHWPNSKRLHISEWIFKDSKRPPQHKHKTLHSTFFSGK